MNNPPSKPPSAQSVGNAPCPGVGSPASRLRRFELLLSLLEDDSPVVLAELRLEFRRAGRAGEPVLRRALHSGSARLRGRARQLLLLNARAQVVRRLVRRASTAIELESSLFLLDNYSSPGLDVRPYRKAMDAMADMVRREAASRPAGPQRVLALVDILSNEMGFQGAGDDFHHPDNIFLGRTIERRRGMPLTLCAVFAFVARRAGLQATLLPFPGHVLLRLHHGPRSKDSRIVDPFGAGQVLSEKQCVSYLSENRLPSRPEWFKGAGDATLFERQVRNLRHSCRGRGRFSEARELGLVVRALERSDRGKAGRG